LAVGQSNPVSSNRRGCPGVLTLAEYPDCPIEGVLVVDIVDSCHIMLVVRGPIALFFDIAVG